MEKGKYRETKRERANQREMRQREKERIKERNDGVLSTALNEAEREREN